MSPQDIKDTFYSTLRDRVSALNQGRTIVVRGTNRPAVLVTENELPTALQFADTFSLAWTALEVDPLGMATLLCEIHSGTAGSPGAAGMDRGRALGALDAELQAALGLPPQYAALVVTAENSGGGASTLTPSGSNLFWTAPAFLPSAMKNERLQRTATVEVFGYE